MRSDTVLKELKERLKAISAVCCYPARLPTNGGADSAFV